MVIAVARSLPLELFVEFLGIVVTVLLLGGIGVRYVLGGKDRPGWALLTMWLAGTGLLILQVAGSHAASEPGVLPIASSAIHWVALVAWAGTAIHLAMLPWERLPAATAPDMTWERLPAATAADTPWERLPAAISAVQRRYARLSLTSLALCGLSGALLAFVHIHNSDALATTAYGSAYKIKLGLSALLLVSVAIRQVGTGSMARARTHVRIEAALLLAVLVTTAVLATRPSPGLAPFLNPQTWNITADDLLLTVDLQPVAGRLGRVRFEIKADQGALAEGTRVSVSMTRGDGRAGLRSIEALPVGPGEFLAETIIAMPGDWLLELDIETADGDVHDIRHEVMLPGPPLEGDMRAYLSLATIGYTPANIVSFVVGLLLIGAAVWSYRLATTGRAPGWLLPLGLANAALGGLLVLSVMFVKTYPSSFWHNPVPLTAETVRAGDALYREHCAECHGLAGRGDGPWAFEHRGGRLPDLTSPHMDTHTDGEIYWWNRYGIPSLEMPGSEDVLTDEENWTVINFMRSLRHGVPPEG